MQCEKTKKWEKKGEILEKRPDSLSYLVDIDGRVAIMSRAFLKPVFEEGQSWAQDHVSLNQDQGEFHSLSTPPLRCSTRIQEKKEEKCFSSSCALEPATPSPKSSVSLSACRGSTDRTPKRQRTPSISRRGGFSLINIQWASFATRATAIIVFALFFLAILLCFWIRSRNICQSRARHGQLLDLLCSSSSSSG